MFLLSLNKFLKAKSPSNISYNVSVYGKLYWLVKLFYNKTG